MDKDIMETLQLIIRNMVTKEDLKNEISGLEKKINESETRINIKIENEVSKKIESLFDGYKLTHEKQWDLERKVDLQQSMIEELANRLSKVENKTA